MRRLYVPFVILQACDLQAVDLWREAAVKYSHPKATYQLAVVTLRGLAGEPVNAVEGRRLMRDAARLGVSEARAWLAAQRLAAGADPAEVRNDLRSHRPTLQRVLDMRPPANIRQVLETGMSPAVAKKKNVSVQKKKSASMFRRGNVNSSDSSTAAVQHSTACSSNSPPIDESAASISGRTSTLMCKAATVHDFRSVSAS